MRRLDDGRLELRDVTEPDDLRATIDRWQDIRVRWWQHRGKRMDPEHASTRFRDFMRELVVLMVPRGLAQVWELRHDGEVVGVEVNLTDRRAYYSWMGAYDPGVSHLGLGKLAIGESIRESIAAGREYYDLMVGDEDYKYWYGATDRHCRWTMAGSGRPLSRVALAAGAAADRAADGLGLEGIGTSCCGVATSGRRCCPRRSTRLCPGWRTCSVPAGPCRRCTRAGGPCAGSRRSGTRPRSRAHPAVPSGSTGTRQSSLSM